MMYQKLKSYFQYTDRILFLIFLISTGISLALLVNFLLDYKIFTIPEAKVTPKKIENKHHNTTLGLNYLFPKEKKPIVTSISKSRVKRAEDVSSEFILKGTIQIDGMRIAIIQYKNKTIFARTGQKIGEYRIRYIDDYFVILDDGNKKYKIFLSVGKEKRKTHRKIFSTKKEDEDTKKVKISRRYISEVKPKDIIKNLLLRPVIEGKEVKGWQVRYVRKGSIFDKYGLKKGDIITSINGIPANKITTLAFLKKELKNAKSIDLEILRNDTPMNILIEIED